MVFLEYYPTSVWQQKAKASYNRSPSGMFRQFRCRKRITESVPHYGDVTVTTMASQIKGVSIVYSTLGSEPDQRKHQCTASLWIHWWPVDSPHSNAENVFIWWRHHSTFHMKNKPQISCISKSHKSTRHHKSAWNNCMCHDIGIFSSASITVIVALQRLAV